MDVPWESWRLVALITIIAVAGFDPGRATASLPPARYRAEPVRIEVLYFDGCPNHETLLARLREILARTGIASPIDLRNITDDEAAQRERFLGSPTVRVNGRDIEPDAERRTDYGLKCRLYRTPAGLSGQPDEAWLEAALHAGAGAEA